MHTMFFSLASALLVGVLQVRAESHTIRFQNNCGSGTPALVRGGQIISTGQDFTSNGPFESAIAYLQDGNCLLNGENCGLLEMNMNNAACPGCGSSSDISFISPHKFSGPVGFSYFGGDGSCDGLGAFCADEGCNTVFYQPNDNQVQRACQADNVNLLITFCGNQPTGFTLAKAGSGAGFGPLENGASGSTPNSDGNSGSNTGSNSGNSPPPSPPPSSQAGTPVASPTTANPAPLSTTVVQGPVVSASSGSNPTTTSTPVLSGSDSGSSSGSNTGSNSSSNSGTSQRPVTCRPRPQVKKARRTLPRLAHLRSRSRRTYF